ncbi:MAG TPA: hypothetical protein VG326_03660 [Tepidisphaeraceae bacterium]|jgi:hypothetical protein|nr:hypothetical protein [Tepidisphaeraceae bacterium]
MKIFPTALFALTLAASATAIPTTQPAPVSTVPATQPAPGAIAELIHQLGADDFHVRRDAGQKLKRMGNAAVPALKEARQSTDPEIQARAAELLQEIDEPPVIVEAVPQGTGASGAHSMSMSISDGSKTVDVHESGRMIHIEESAAGIKMTVTGQIDGKEVTRNFKAQTPDKLQKQNPPAFALYRQYAGNGGVGIRGLHIQGGNGVGINNINVRMNVNVGPNGINIVPLPPPDGLLGVTLAEPAAGGDGVKVLHLLPESRAAKIGVKEQDLIQKLNGNAIHSSADLRKVMIDNPKDLVIEGLRDGKPFKLTEEKKAEAAEQKKN